MVKNSRRWFTSKRKGLSFSVTNVVCYFFFQKPPLVFICLFLFQQVGFSTTIQTQQHFKVILQLLPIPDYSKLNDLGFSPFVFVYALTYYQHGDKVRCFPFRITAHFLPDEFIKNTVAICPDQKKSSRIRSFRSRDCKVVTFQK